MMRRGARFHSHQAWRKVGEERRQFGPSQTAPQRNVSVGSNTVDLEHALGQIEANN
jgi:hypothetical protein